MSAPDPPPRPPVETKAKASLAVAVLAAVALAAVNLPAESRESLPPWLRAAVTVLAALAPAFAAWAAPHTFRDDSAALERTPPAARDALANIGYRTAAARRPAMRRADYLPPPPPPPEPGPGEHRQP